MIEAMSWDEFQQKYSGLRDLIYKDVPLQLGIPMLRLTPINTTALRAKNQWPDVSREPPNGGWDWDSWTSYFKSRHKKFFDVAIWHGNELCGLVLGRLSRNNVKVRLELIEGSSVSGHPLKGDVVYIGLSAIEAFGAVVGAEESLIIDPVEGVIPAYNSLGYQLRFGGKRIGRYMSKSLN